MPAISRHSVMPPAWHRSGWRIVAAFFSSTSRKPHFVKTRSPVAIGRCVPRAISAITSWFCQLIGSSLEIGWCGSSALISTLRRADGTLEVDGDIDVLAVRLAQLGELLRERKSKLPYGCL